MVADAQDEAERLQEGVAEAELAVAQAAAEVATARASLDSLDEEIAAQSALVSKHDLEVARLAGAVEVARSRLAAVRGEQLRQTNALEAAQVRLESSRAEFGALETDEGEAPGSDVDHDSITAAADERATTAQSEADRLRDALHTAERERDSLAARTSALSLALDQKEASSALVKSGRPGVRGLVAEHVQVDAATRPRSPRPSGRSPTRCWPTTSTRPWGPCSTSPPQSSAAWRWSWGAPRAP